MTKQQEQRPTAKIYMFPTKPRATSGSQHHAFAQQMAATQFATVECGAGWYHDAAIDEADDLGDVPYQRH